MKTDDNWYEGIKKQLELLENSLTERDYKKYRLGMLLCVAERVAQFSPECEQCQMFRQDVTTLAEGVGDIAEMSDKGSRKHYFKSMDGVISHLRKQHNLVVEGYCLGERLGIGTVVGLPTGITLGNIALGVPIGLAMRAAIGTSLGAKARRECRVLCPRETKGSPRTGLV